MAENESVPDWKRLEQLVAAIQQQLAPDAKVTHNAKLYGHKTEGERQIDVLVEQAIGQFLLRIVIDCKDYKTPIDVKGVEEFHGLVDDVGANKGALVCPAGFTRRAKKRAKGLQMDLYSPADTGSHKWQVKMEIPAVCDFRSTYMSFRVSVTGPAPFMLSARQATYLGEIAVFDALGQPQGTIIEIASRQWDAGMYAIEVGKHEHLPLKQGLETKIDNGYGTLVPVELTVGLDVTSQLYAGHFPIQSLRGLKDEQSGAIITNAFQFNALHPDIVINNWKKIDRLEDAPTPPAVVLTGLYCWGVK